MEEKKKKGFAGRVLGICISALLLILISMSVVQMYPGIVNGAKGIDEEEYAAEIRELSMENYMSNAFPLVYGIYIDCLYNQGETGTAGELLFAPMLEEYREDSDNYIWILSAAAEVTFWYENEYKNLLEELQMEYLAVDNVSKEKYAGTLDDTSTMTQEQYPFQITVQCTDGTIQVLQEWGTMNGNIFIDYYENGYDPWKQTDFRYAELNSYYSPEVTITLASKSDLYANFYYYDIEWMNRRQVINNMEVDYMIVVAGAFFAVLLLGLFLPFIRPLGLNKGIKANLPFELIAVAVSLSLLVIIEEIPYIVYDTQRIVQMEESPFIWSGMLQNFMTRGRENVMLLLLNGAMWFLLLSVFYLCVLSFRQLFSKGLWKYLKENTVIGIVITWIIRQIRRFFASMKDIDLEDNGHKVIFKVVLVNFLLIVFFSCIWFAGIAGAIIYSVVIFLVLCKYWKKIQEEYQSLLSTTREMAEGSTKVEYKESNGLFKGLLEELKKVQFGFNKSVQEEIKSQRMKTELITNVSHDLKTPLTAIITYVDLLKDESLSEEERKTYIQVLEQKSTRLKILIEDLFEISKANSQNIVIHRVNMDLTALIQEVQVELEDRIMKSGIEFKLSVPEEKVLVALDSQKTYRIFENLMTNIIKYGLRGSRAYISMEVQPDTVTVILKNISETELNFDASEIMERFVRGDESRNTEGSGLGLAIAKSFAEAQGGTLQIEIDGDLFKAIVTLPRTAMEPQETATDTERESEADVETELTEKREPEPVETEQIESEPVEPEQVESEQ